MTPTVVRGAGLSAVGLFATQSATLVAYIVLARLASPSTFGAFAAAAIVVTVGGFLSESGMLAALVSRSGPMEEATATATASTLVGGVLLCLLGLALAPIVGLFFRSAEIGQVSAVLAGILFLNAAAVVPSALLQRRLSLRPLLVAEPLAALVLGLAGGLALAAGLGIWGLAIGAYVSAVARTGSIWLLAGWIPRIAGASWAMWRELVRYARHIVASEAIKQSGTMASTAIIGRALGTGPLGQFRYAWRVATAGASVVSVGSYFLFPVFSQITGEPERFRSAFERSLRISAFAFFPVTFLFLALGHPLVVLLFGDAWSEAGWALVALSALPALRAVGSVCAEALKAAGRPDVLPSATLFTAVVTIALIFPLLVFGAVGVGLAFSIGTGSAVAYSLVRTAPIVGARTAVILRQLSIPAAAGTVAAGFTFALDQGVVDAAARSTGVGLVLLGIEILLGALVYVGAARVLSRSAVAEFRTILGHLLKRVGGSGGSAPVSGSRTEVRRVG
jgi:O-antigen/teichoic acid export membrane protein